MNPIKLNIGAGKFIFNSGWFSSDIYLLNILDAKSWFYNLLFFKASNIMAEHVWEHLTYEDGTIAAKNCYDYLKKEGTLRIAVPDGYHPDQNYINYVKPGGHGLGADDHKLLFNHVSLTQMLESIGFSVQLLEYWDKDGIFHSVDWTNDGGKIQRSKRYDHRNKDGKLNYTSLIVDAIK